MQVDFELIGTNPLLMHNDDVVASDELSEWRKDPANKNVSVAGDDRSPPWTWQTYLYRDGASVVMPSANIMVALRAAGAQVILKKNKTFKELTQSGMAIKSEYCQFFASGKPIAIADVLALKDRPFRQQFEGVKPLGFSLYVKRARVGQSKHVRVRPRFDAWSVRGAVAVVASEITFELLEKFFDLAGMGGLCDWRPQGKTPGSFGQFTAKLKLRK